MKFCGSSPSYLYQRVSVYETQYVYDKHNRFLKTSSLMWIVKDIRFKGWVYISINDSLNFNSILFIEGSYDILL